jgi:hypothetical protein
MTNKKIEELLEKQNELLERVVILLENPRKPQYVPPTYIPTVPYYVPTPYLPYEYKWNWTITS